MEISLEEKFLVNLLFKEKKIIKSEVENLNLEKIIKIGSAHLIIPLIFSKIKEKGLTKIFEKDFISYIESIYKLNLERNIELNKEIDILHKIFKENNLKVIYLKGAAMVIGKYYDIGVRMIGDLDFLISREDINKIQNLLNFNKYFEIKKERFFDFRHLPRRIKKNKIFAIEPHTYLLKSTNFLPAKKIFNSSINVFEKKIPNIQNQIFLNIYNFQINDFGYSSLNYSYRNIYDTIKLIEKSNFKYDKKNKYLRRYFTIISILNIYDIKNLKMKECSKTKFLLYLKRNFKKIFNVYYNASILINNKDYFMKRMRLFLISKKYRDYKKYKISSRFF